MLLIKLLWVVDRTIGELEILARVSPDLLGISEARLEEQEKNCRRNTVVKERLSLQRCGKNWDNDDPVSRRTTCDVQWWKTEKVCPTDGDARRSNAKSRSGFRMSARDAGCFWGERATIWNRTRKRNKEPDKCISRHTGWWLACPNWRKRWNVSSGMHQHYLGTLFHMAENVTAFYSPDSSCLRKIHKISVLQD